MGRRSVGTQDNRRVNELLDFIRDKMHLKNDAAMCRFLGWEPPAISKMRRGHQNGLSAIQMIDIHLATDLSMTHIIGAVNDVNSEARNG